MPHALVICVFSETQCSMDSLKFVASWRGNIQGAKLNIKIGNLQLEGCSFDGTRLSENQRGSPSVSEIPPCTVAFIPKVGSLKYPLPAILTSTYSYVISCRMPLSPIRPMR